MDRSSVEEVGLRPIVTFDTSVCNSFVDDQRSLALLDKVKSKRHVRIAGLCIEEFVATRDPVKRRALFSHANAMIQEREEITDVLLPPKDLIAKLVWEHWNNPWTFDWLKVEVRTVAYNHELDAGELISDDSLSAAQSEQQLRLSKEYKREFQQHRQHFQGLLLHHNQSPPKTFREHVQFISAAPRKGPYHRRETLLRSLCW